MHFVYTADETNTYSRNASMSVAHVYAFMIYSIMQNVIFIEDRITPMITNTVLSLYIFCRYAYFKADFFYNQNVCFCFYIQQTT